MQHVSPTHSLSQSVTQFLLLSDFRMADEFIEFQGDGVPEIVRSGPNFSPFIFTSDEDESLFLDLCETHPNHLAFSLTMNIFSPKDEHERTMSAILLCRMLTPGSNSSIWGQLKESIQSDIKRILLDILRFEKSRGIIQMVSHIVAKLASALLPCRQWSSLLPFLSNSLKHDPPVEVTSSFDSGNSGSPPSKELIIESTFLILSELASRSIFETSEVSVKVLLTDLLVSKISYLCQVFLARREAFIMRGGNEFFLVRSDDFIMLNEDVRVTVPSMFNEDVKVAALSAVINFIRCLTSSNLLDTFNDLLPPMMRTIEVLSSSSSSRVKSQLEMPLKLLIKLAREKPLFLDQKNVIGSMLKVAKEVSCEERTRYLAVKLVITLVEALEIKSFKDITCDRLFTISDLFAALAYLLSNHTVGQKGWYKLGIALDNTETIIHYMIMPVVCEKLRAYLATQERSERDTALAQIADECSKLQTLSCYLSSCLQLRHWLTPREAWEIMIKLQENQKMFPAPVSEDVQKLMLQVAKAKDSENQGMRDLAIEFLVALAEETKQNPSFESSFEINGELILVLIEILADYFRQWWTIQTRSSNHLYRLVCALDHDRNRYATVIYKHVRAVTDNWERNKLLGVLPVLAETADCDPQCSMFLLSIHSDVLLR